MKSIWFKVIEVKSRVLIFLLLVVITICNGGQLACAESISTTRSSDVELSTPDKSETFTFAILGDRTDGPAKGLEILAEAIEEINLFGPDFTFNVGDMINGYNAREEWLRQMREYKGVITALEMPFYPVAGNHDVYWRGENRPANEHEDDYEKHFGPLWYSVEHKGCVFIALFSDEGNLTTGHKNYSDPLAQKMSPQQIDWLKATLKKQKNARHVFLFLHHPRWTGDGYGNDWDRVHAILRSAGNVSAVFAGHTHVNKYNGIRDGIEYFTLGTTGGDFGEVDPLRGREHRTFIVNVDSETFYIAAMPVGSVVNPRYNPIIITPLLKTRGWTVSSDKNRVQKWSVVIPRYESSKATIRIGLSHGADDSGDDGIEYRLLTGKGKKVLEGFTKKGGYEWITHPVKTGEKYTFVIADRDTVFTGKYPGNAGKVRIDLEEVVEK